MQSQKCSICLLYKQNFLTNFLTSKQLLPVDFVQQYSWLVSIWGAPKTKKPQTQNIDRASFSYL